MFERIMMIILMLLLSLFGTGSDRQQAQQAAMPAEKPAAVVEPQEVGAQEAAEVTKAPVKETVTIGSQDARQIPSTTPRPTPQRISVRTPGPAPTATHQIEGILDGPPTEASATIPPDPTPVPASTPPTMSYGSGDRYEGEPFSAF